MSLAHDSREFNQDYERPHLELVQQSVGWIAVSTELGIDHRPNRIDSAAILPTVFPPTQYRILDLIESEARGSEGWLFNRGSDNRVLLFVEQELGIELDTVRKRMNDLENRHAIEERRMDVGGVHAVTNVRLTWSGEKLLTNMREKYPDKIAALDTDSTVVSDERTIELRYEELNNMRYIVGLPILRNTTLDMVMSDDERVQLFDRLTRQIRHLEAYIDGATATIDL